MEITSSIILTESAASHISEMLVDDTTNTGKSLRVYVEGGGCSGLQYGEHNYSDAECKYSIWPHFTLKIFCQYLCCIYCRMAPVIWTVYS